MEGKNFKAETWISVHYPFRKEWIVRQKGIFSRNYSGDIRSCSPDEAHVELSRDGLYEILPNALFFTGRELIGKDDTDFKWTEKILKQRFDRIKTVMLPFDSSYFNHTLALENTVNANIGDKTKTLLQTIVGNDFSNESDPYIKQMSPYTLQAATLRGDYRTLCRLMTLILGYKTDYRLKKGRVTFIVNRPDLSHEGFMAYYDELKPFFSFVEEWFIPFEMNFEYKIRDYKRSCRFAGPNKLLLDYNSTLPTHNF